MNKAELISEIAKQTSLTKTDTEKFLNALVSTISSSMKNDEQVQLFGLGTFKTITRAARHGVNPITHKQMDIPAKKAVKFKASKNILNA